jgi:hypothetical protein
MDPFLLGTGLFILGAVVWVVCAIYAYRLAPTYGRGAWPWAIAAIIFGPFALFALVLLPKKSAKAGQGQHEDSHAALYERPRKH